MREVGTTIWLQREFVEGWDGAGVDRLGGSLNQIVDEGEKQHREGEVRRDWPMRHLSSESASKRSKGAEYTLDTRVADKTGLLTSYR